MAMKMKTLAKLGIAPLALVLATGVASAQMKVAPQTTAPSSPMISKTSMGTAYQIPLSKVTDAKTTLASASVVDMDGNSVGAVHDVKADADGKAQEIRVDVGGFLGVGSKLVALTPSRLKYERDRNVLITDMTKDEIKALPETKA